MTPQEKKLPNEEIKRQYQPPEIVYEVELETQAGSATGGDELPPGLNP